MSSAIRRFQKAFTFAFHSHAGFGLDFLGTRNSVLPQTVLFILPDKRFYIMQNTCVYIHIWQRTHCAGTDCIWIAVATKWHCSETFVHKLGLEWNVDWKCTDGVPTWLWMGEYVKGAGQVLIGRIRQGCRPGVNWANTSGVPARC